VRQKEQIVKISKAEQSKIIAERAVKARAEASRLYPAETWREIEPSIFLARSREPKNSDQFEVLEKERKQARILVKDGHTVYLLPEINTSQNFGTSHPDAVVDGYVMEFKTITGNAGEVEKRFKESRKQAEKVFMRIDAPLKRDEVSRQLQGLILKKNYQGGEVIAYFSETDKLYYWSIDDLRGR
jgi:hypothetical protein